MGVHLNVVAISEINIEQALHQPELIWNIIQSDYSHHRQLLAEPFNMHLSVGHYWHALHFLLSGKVWSGNMPESFLIDGGSYIGHIDMGYGPARAFTCEEVKTIDTMLSNKKPDDLAQRFNPYYMLDADIYPQIWDDNPSALSECLKHFKQLQYFMRHAAEDNRGMVIYLSKHED